MWRHFYKEVLELAGHFLRLFGRKISSWGQRPMKHLYYLYALGSLKMKKHVLAEYEAEVAPYGLQREEVVPLVRDPVPHRISNLQMAPSVHRGKILFMQVSRDPLQIFFGVGAGSHGLSETVSFLYVRCINLQILKSKMAHMFCEEYGKRVHLLSHCTSRVPDLHIASSHDIRNDTLHDQFQDLHVSEEECECHLCRLVLGRHRESGHIENERDGAVAHDGGP
jgi:hypothetical protein